MSTALDSRPRFTRRRDSLGLGVCALVWAIATAFAAAALQDSPHVERITIDNPHPWRVNVDVTDADGESWVGVGAVVGEHEQTFHMILDQGDAWTVRFSYGGQYADVHLTGFQLEQVDWRVAVPDQLASRLRSADVPETPR